MFNIPIPGSQLNYPWQGYILWPSTKISPPPEFFWNSSLFICELFFAVIRAYIKQGKKISIVSHLNYSFSSLFLPFSHFFLFPDFSLYFNFFPFFSKVPPLPTLARMYIPDPWLKHTVFTYEVPLLETDPDVLVLEDGGHVLREVDVSLWVQYQNVISRIRVGRLANWALLVVFGGLGLE